jgi:integrase
MVEPEFHIDPCGIYTGEQTEELLKGFVGLETLRKKGGLKGLPAGYFGGSILSPRLSTDTVVRSGPSVVRVFQEDRPVSSLTIEERTIHYIGEYVAVEKRRSVFSVTGKGRRFTIRRIGPNRWRANGRSFTDAYKSDYPRLTISAPSLETALAQAVEKLFGEKREPQVEGIEVSEVFARWKKTKDVQPETMKAYVDGIDRFLQWADTKTVQRWKDLSRGTLQEYLVSLSEYRTNYRKNLWKPIRAASLWTSLEWPGVFSDIAGKIQISDTGPLYPDEKVSLSLVEAAEFCIHLSRSEDGWRILPGVVLQSICGLRLTEAHRLRWDSIDFPSRTLTVQGQVKGRYAVRRIPLPQFVVDVLLDSPKVGDRVLHEYDVHPSFSKAVARAIREWSPGTGLEPKGLRRTLESEAASRGWEGYAFNRFLGRSPASIAERHYIAVGPKLMDILREQVTDRVDEVLAPTRRKCQAKDPKVIQLQVS